MKLRPPTVAVLLGDGHNQAEVGLGQLVLGQLAVLHHAHQAALGALRKCLSFGSQAEFCCFTLLVTPCQRDLLLKRQQLNLTDLLEIATNRIGGGGCRGELPHTGFQRFKVLVLWLREFFWLSFSKFELFVLEFGRRGLDRLSAGLVAGLCNCLRIVNMLILHGSFNPVPSASGSVSPARTSF